MERTGFHLTNTTDHELVVTMEPWGEIYRLAPGATYDVVGIVLEGDRLELEVTDKGLVVYGTSGGTAYIFHEGVEVNGWDFEDPFRRT